MLRATVSLGALGIPCLAMADPLVTDRPDFTESPETVAKGRVQVEAGATFERSGDERTRSLGEVLVRVGMGKHSELRIGLPSHLRLSGGGSSVSGWDDAYLGAKFVLREGEGRSPQVALLAGTTLPTGSRRMAERKYQPDAVLAAAIDLNEKTALSTNIGVARASSSGERFNQLFGSLSLGYSLSDRWGIYGEVYAFNRNEPGGSTQKYANTGLTYLVNDDFQLDARFGVGLNNGPRERFWGLGVARRF
jgi:hypothetical protein